MKEIFLSFKPEYFKPILYGLKKYEYRKRFCNEEVCAYLYLSGNKRKVIGIMELGVPIRLDKTVDEYTNDTRRRVIDYINARDVCAIPIKSLRLFESPLSLESIRKSIPNFMPPQMYYILNNNIKLKELMKKQRLKECEFIHKHDKIYDDNLAMSVREIMKTPKYKEIDAVIDKMSDYKDIL